MSSDLLQVKLIGNTLCYDVRVFDCVHMIKTLCDAVPERSTRTHEPSLIFLPFSYFISLLLLNLFSHIKAVLCQEPQTNFSLLP